MNWNRLKNLECPTCSRVLMRNARNDGYRCPCGFFITNGKFNAIVNKIYQKSGRTVEDPDKNLIELNNL